MGTMTKDKCTASFVRKAGFTLVELLVYIGIVGIVVIVAGQAFSNSTKMRIRTQSMLKASEVAENVAYLFKEDVAQTGAKSSMESGTENGWNKFSDVKESVYMHPTDAAHPENIDLSSYSITKDGNFSNLRVRRMRYNSQGYYKGVEEINWFVLNNVLKRSCKTVESIESLEDCAPSDAEDLTSYTVDVASGVSTFKVTPATPSVSGGSSNAQQFPPCVGGVCGEAFRLAARYNETNFANLTISSSSENNAATLSGFATNYKMNENNENKTGKLMNQVFAMENVDNASTSWKDKCYQLTLSAHQEYEISFTLTDGGTDSEKMRLFVPGRDHMSVGFRDVVTGNIPKKDGVELLHDFMFYPPADNSDLGSRHIRFTTPGQEISKVCLAFSFASYSPLAANGTVVISNLKLSKVEMSNYRFDDADIPVADRKFVKAMRLELGIKENGEEGRTTLVIWTPSNGPAD